MKLAIDDMRMVDLGGVEPSKVKAYGMGSAAVMQTIVRQSMYSDPVKAVVCEYLCNGEDSHRERKRAQPDFDERTPLVLNFSHNSLSIEDSGLGISRDRMENNFASYFSSTKQGNNDDIGGFGLGCKTAFADPNRDSFVVDTVYREAGKTYFYRTYHFINKQALTAFAEMAHQEVEDSEPTGTKIVLPIDESDLDKYTTAIKRVCKYWDVKPTVIGIDGFEYESHEPFLTGDGWHYTPRLGKIDVVVDRIPYSVNTSLLPSGLTSINPGLTLFFPNGSLQVTSTRESLDYRGDTIDKITQAAYTAMAEIKIRLGEKLSELGLFDVKEAIETFGVIATGYEWVASGVRFEKVSVFTRCGNAVKADRTDYIGVARHAKIMFCGYRGSTKIARGRAMTYLELNPSVQTLFVLPIPFETTDQVLKELNRRHADQLFEMVEENWNFRKVPVHSSYRSVANRRRCHKFLFEWDGNKWRKLSADDEVPEHATYVVLRTGEAPSHAKFDSRGTDVFPDFLIQELHRRKIPTGWSHIRDELVAVVQFMRGGDLSIKAPVTVRVGNLEPLYYEHGKLDQAVLVERQKLSKTFQQLLKFGDDMTEDGCVDERMFRLSGTDLDQIDIDKGEILAKVIRRYDFVPGSLRSLLTKVRRKYAEASRDKRKEIKNRYDGILQAIRQMP